MNCELLETVDSRLAHIWGAYNCTYYLAPLPTEKAPTATNVWTCQFLMASARSTIGIGSSYIGHSYGQFINVPMPMVDMNIPMPMFERADAWTSNNGLFIHRQVPIYDGRWICAIICSPFFAEAGFSSNTSHQQIGTSQLKMWISFFFCWTDVGVGVAVGVVVEKTYSSIEKDLI